MSGRHTPGPWQTFSLITKAGRNKLGFQSSKSRMFDMTIYDDEDVANARLVVAAPDLLAALIDLADVARSYIGAMDADDLAALERARAAIVKARQ